MSLTKLFKKLAATFLLSTALSSPIQAGQADAPARLDNSPIKVNDVSVRDGQQSLLAGRVTIEDIIAIQEASKGAGFNNAENWGGSTYDIAMRFKGEDPIENLDRMVDLDLSIPSRMLSRGQSLVGYKNYADDVVKRFIKMSADHGMKVFRFFDALNDKRNLQASFDAINELKSQGYDVQAQGTICYTTDPEGIHTADYFVERALEQQAMGADSIAIKDMAGLLTPEAATELVTKLKEKLDIPVVLHMHDTMGRGLATARAAVKAGVDEVDTANDAIAGTSSLPSTQDFVEMLETDPDPDVRARAPKLNKDVLETQRQAILKARTKYAHLEGQHNAKLVVKLEAAGIPGGMITTLLNQLETQLSSVNKSRQRQGSPLVDMDKAVDLILSESQRVRKDFGWIALVTPTSQIVGTQAFNNVIHQIGNNIDPNIASWEDRYGGFTEASKALLLGQFGQTPGEINEEIVQLIENKDKKKRITHRPADDLPPGFPIAERMIWDQYFDIYVRRTQKISELQALAKNTPSSWEKMDEREGITEQQRVLHEEITLLGLQLKNLENPTEEDILMVAMWDAVGLDFIQNKHDRSKTKAYEGKPENPGGEFGKILEATGTAYEDIVQSYLKLETYLDGTIKGLNEEFHDRKVAETRERIEFLVQDIPHRLQEKGFESSEIGRALHILDDEIAKRTEKLGVTRLAKPHKSLFALRQAADDIDEHAVLHEQPLPLAEDFSLIVKVDAEPPSNSTNAHPAGVVARPYDPSGMELDEHIQRHIG